jgi:hypothetical protein
MSILHTTHNSAKLDNTQRFHRTIFAIKFHQFCVASTLKSHWFLKSLRKIEKRKKKIKISLINYEKESWFN